MSLEAFITARHNIYPIEEATSTVGVMLIGKNYVSYAICDEAMDIVYLIQHFNSGNKPITKTDFHEILSHPEILKATKTHVALDSFKSVIVPYELYNPENKLDYFGMMEDISPDEEVVEYNLTDSIVDLFVMRHNTRIMLDGILPNAKLYSASAVLLKTYPTCMIEQKEYNFYISVKEEFVILTLYRNKTLLLHQLYPVSTEMDVLYHVCHVVHQFKIKPNYCCIQVHGENKLTDMAKDILNTHFHFVKYCTRVKNIQYPDAIFNEPTHYFYNLFSIFPCAL